MVLAGCYSDAHDYRRLVDSNAAVAGQVVHVDCSSHGLVVYAFVVNGSEHRAKAPPGTLSCESARRGDPVNVTYDPAHPEVNTLLTPQAAYERAVGWYLPEPAFLFGVIAVGIVFSIAPYVRKRVRGGVRGDQGSVK